MLILSRKENESIMIGDDIKITVMEIRKRCHHLGQVRIGIQAPKNIAVHREEIWLEIQGETKCPSTTTPS